MPFYGEKTDISFIFEPKLEREGEVTREGRVMIYKVIQLRNN